MVLLRTISFGPSFFDPSSLPSLGGSGFSPPLLLGLARPADRPGALHGRRQVPPAREVSARSSTSRSRAGSDVRASSWTRSTISWLCPASAAPFSVTEMIRARRSWLEGRRSASPALSRASTVTTIVVLSMSPISASWIWVRSSSRAWTSTQCIRAVRPISPSAADIRVRRTWLVWSRRKDRSGAVRAGAMAVMPASVTGRSVRDHPQMDDRCRSGASSAYGPSARRRSADSRYSTPVMPRAVAASTFSCRSSTNRHRSAGTPARSAAIR